MLVLRRLMAFVAANMPVLFGGAAFAQDGPLGEPHPWQVGLQQAVTPVMDNISWFNDFLFYIITAIALLVFVLLLVVIVRFNSRKNPVASRTTHNTVIEVVWTVVPVLILVSIAVPSFRLLFYQTHIPKADLTVKASGKQWFWSYSYPDDKFEFDSLLVQDKDLKQGQPRLLTVDNDMVVPVNKTVRVLTSGADVIHSWAVPAFGVKIDAIPGRINETWFKAEHTGTFRGQCSQLCGRDHAFMPIVVHVVTDQEYAAWLSDAKKKYASTDVQPVAVAIAETR